VCIACTYEASLCINVGVYLNVYAYVDVYANVSCVYRLQFVKSLSTHMCVVLCGGALQCVAVCCSRWHMYTCRVTHGKETRQTHNPVKSQSSQLRHTYESRHTYVCVVS